MSSAPPTNMSSSVDTDEIFHIGSTLDQVLLNILDESRIAGATTASFIYFKCNLEKVFIAHQLKQNKAQIVDLSALLGGLDLYQDGAPVTTTETRKDMGTKSRWERAIKHCYHRMSVAARRHINTQRDAASCVQYMIERRGSSPIPFVGKRNLDTMTLVVYAIVSDRFYQIDRAILSSPAFTFQLQVVTYLKLCGGRPATSETLSQPQHASVPQLIGDIFRVHDQAHQSSPHRLGGLSINADDDAWFVQRAENLDALDMEVNKWEKLDFTTIKEVKKWRINTHVFVIHKTQLNLPAAIKAKQDMLRGGALLDGMAWALWKPTGPGTPLVPLEFVPEFDQRPVGSLDIVKRLRTATIEPEREEKWKVHDARKEEDDLKIKSKLKLNEVKRKARNDRKRLAFRLKLKVKRQEQEKMKQGKKDEEEGGKDQGDRNDHERLVFRPKLQVQRQEQEKTKQGKKDDGEGGKDQGDDEGDEDAMQE